MDPQTIKTQVLYSLKKEVETNDAQTTRRPPMVYLWPSYGSGFQTFHKSPQSRSYPCLVRVVPYGFMVYLDPGARCLVYLQPQQRMVPSKSPLQISNQNVIFFFSQVSIQKGSSESFFGPTQGVPQNNFIFVPPSKVFPRSNILARL